MPRSPCSRIAGGVFERSATRRRLEELEHLVSKPDLWSNPDSARRLTTERADLAHRLDAFQALEFEIAELAELSALTGEEDQAELDALLVPAIEQLEAWRISLRTAHSHDHLPCFITLAAGQGGREAQDWTRMLERMYLRWADTHGCDAEEIERETTDEGLRTATWRIAGAFGRLKHEAGIHRLIRISPFGAGSRQTSFASVDVTPDLPPAPQYAILEKDLEITTFRSSGAGGQNVQKVESAVRIRHRPTGLVVACQRERSQHANRTIAMKLLQGKIEAMKARAAAEAEAAREDGKPTAGFGRQLRSMVLTPYRLAKDHVSGFETGNVDRVLDGDIDGFIEAAMDR